MFKTTDAKVGGSSIPTGLNDQVKDQILPKHIKQNSCWVTYYHLYPAKQKVLTEYSLVPL